MPASSKHTYGKTLAFPDTYYGVIINLLQSVELFCAYILFCIFRSKWEPPFRYWVSQYSTLILLRCYLWEWAYLVKPLPTQRCDSRLYKMCSISYPSHSKNNCIWSGSLCTGQVEQLQNGSVAQSHSSKVCYKILLTTGLGGISLWMYKSFPLK